MNKEEKAKCMEIIDLFRVLRQISFSVFPSKENPWIPKAYLNSLDAGRLNTFNEIRSFRNEFVFSLLPAPPEEPDRWIKFLKEEIARLQELIKQKSDKGAKPQNERKQ